MLHLRRIAVATCLVALGPSVLGAPDKAWIAGHVDPHRAVSLLARFGRPGMDELIRRYGSLAPQARVAVCSEFAAWAHAADHPGAIRGLVVAAHDEVLQIRQLAYKSLARVSPRESPLGDKYIFVDARAELPSVRAAALSVLPMAKNRDRALEALISAMDDPSEVAQAAAFASLSIFPQVHQHPLVLRGVLRALRRPHRESVTRAVLSLCADVQIRDEEVVEQVRRLLVSPAFQGDAINALGRIGRRDSVTVTKLRRLLAIEDVAGPAAVALTRLGAADDAVAAVLADPWLRRDNDETTELVRETPNLWQHLVRIDLDGKAFVGHLFRQVDPSAMSSVWEMVLLSAQRGICKKRRIRALQLMGTMGHAPPFAIRRLRDHLVEQDSDLLAATVESLARLGDVSTAVSFLSARWPASVRRAAARGIHSLAERDASAVPAVVEDALDDEDPDVVQHVIDTIRLRGLAGERAVRTLARRLEHKRHCQAAAWALSTLGRSARPALMRLQRVVQQDKAAAPWAIAALLAIGPSNPSRTRDAMAKGVKDPHRLWALGWGSGIPASAVASRVSHSRWTALAIDLAATLETGERLRFARGLLKHPYWRTAGARVLGALGRRAQEAVPDLQAALVDGESAIDVVSALGQVASPHDVQVSETLIRFLNDERVARASLAAIQAQGCKDPELAAWVAKSVHQDDLYGLASAPETATELVPWAKLVCRTVVRVDPFGKVLPRLVSLLGDRVGDLR